VSRLRPLLGALACAAALSPPAALAAGPTAAQRAVHALANECRTLAAGGAATAPLSFKATGLGTYLLTDPAGRLLGVRADGTAGPAGGPEDAGPHAEWRVARVAPGAFTLRSTATRRWLSVGPDGTPALGDTPVRLALAPAAGCRAFPEAELNVAGDPPPATRPDGTIRGFADTHLHITADMRAGGAVFGGEPFDRFGIVRALGRDAEAHGADGGLDHTGNLLRDGVPFGTHDTRGWPTFTGWPTHDTNTHEQIYFRWLERAWRAGLRLTVAHVVEDEIICAIEPRRRYSCDETTAIRGQIRRLRALQEYVDAQSGGPGRGWLRLVRDARQARRVMARGKLAVVVGVESSFPLDCRSEPARRRCTPRQVDRRLDALHRLGVRALFVAHWADNGFAGAAVEGGVKGTFINAMQRIATGRWFDVGRCPHPRQGEELRVLSRLEIDVVSGFFPATAVLKDAAPPSYGTGRFCNVRGLTRLGRHLVRRMMAKGMLIEMDHMSERAREQVLAMAERARYPLVSGHSDTGGLWTDGELRRLAAIGGTASQRLEAAPDLARAIVRRGRFGGHGVALGTDTGGFATLPGPAADAAANPLAYPFRLAGGPLAFDRQRTGERTFDLNADGVAHYGLLPDLLADMERRPQGAEAMALLMRSAEGYLRVWERAERRARALRR